jgi:hypothetical protein
LPVSADLQTLVQVLRARFGDALSGLLFYGSCLRSGDASEGLADLYVVVDDYANLNTSALSKLANRWLPPTVFLLQTPTPDGRTLRAKCAVISLADFEKGTGEWFQSYLWGRFSQPSRLVFYRNQSVRERLHTALANAVMRIAAETLPTWQVPFSSAALWQRAFSLTYGTELRPEAASRPAEIVMHNADYYGQVTRAMTLSPGTLQAVGPPEDSYVNLIDSVSPSSSLRRWKLRRIQGRTLNVARLLKSFFTFEDGIGYVIWKLERHLGEPVPVTPRLRRFPLIFCWPLLWRLVRSRRLR